MSRRRFAGTCAMTDAPTTTGHIDEIWRGSTSLHWVPDGFGRPDRSLNAGGLHVGLIQHIPQPRYGHESTPWRGWIMSDEDGKELGWFATEQEAKDAVVDAAVRELCR